MEFYRQQTQRIYVAQYADPGLLVFAFLLLCLVFSALPARSFAQADIVQGVADARPHDAALPDLTEGDEDDADADADAGVESTGAEDDPFMNMSLQDAYQRSVSVSQPEIDPQKIESLFFTPWQYSLLQEAKRGFRTRAPTQGDLADDTQERKYSIREISLGGIVFKSAENWTIWLNGQRVTPDAIPEAVLDIEVDQRFVQMKWFDSYTNLIFPIRLRPHERFNLDSRIFLPGKGT